MSILNEDLLVTQAERAKLINKINDLSAHWSEWDAKFEGESMNFYTLGAASYLEGYDQAKYIEHANEINPVLNREFGWLYERLITSLEKSLGGSCRFKKDAGLPGFHIFNCHKLLNAPLASVHFDLQHELQTWPEGESVDLSTTLSFTLSLSLPKVGAGLNIWPIVQKDYPGLDLSEPREIAKTVEKKYVPYKEGYMVLHTGHLLHQIAPSSGAIGGDNRITLQGHGIKVGDTYQLYW